MIRRNAAVTEWAEKYLSLTADFQNYKKRVTQERTDWAHDAQKQVFIELLAIIDNFERALEQEKKRENAAGVAWLAGFEMIYQSLEKVLAKFGFKKLLIFLSLILNIMKHWFKLNPTNINQVKLCRFFKKDTPCMIRLSVLLP